MPVTVKVFTKHGGRPTLFQTRDFEALPVTIGRDATCTLALDDPQKHISRVHVELEEEDGTYWMSVVSKVNPVMVKGRRYGPGTRLTLKSGDSFEMGEFEVQVVFPEKVQPAPPPPPPAEKKSLIQALAEEGTDSTDIPPPEAGIFDEPTLMGSTEEPTYMGPAMKIAAAPPPPPPPPPPVEKRPAPVESKPAPAPRPAPAAAAPSSGSLNEALRLMLEGAGMPSKDMSAAEAEKLLRDSGTILRAAVEGLMMLLIARSEMRKEFEAEERTMVAARDNNPLKLMGDPHEAMQFLMDPGGRTGGFLEPVQAIGDACEDLRAHELALMTGMRSAILGALRKFDPKTIEKSLEKSSGFSFGGKKAKLWEAFVEHQSHLAQEAQEDFNKIFGRDFMSAYQAQIRKLKSGK
ncbi:MAG TPA: type VI secretion system-associated FHA domain protein TagH [Burkholderiales bacterium]|jgi:type VI secretion system FHA domain protein|nr:type VI secretion system-associated FHA domain protein TagH [Burkholderiales bacterium]